MTARILASESGRLVNRLDVVERSRAIRVLDRSGLGVCPNAAKSSRSFPRQVWRGSCSWFEKCKHGEKSAIFFRNGPRADVGRDLQENARVGSLRRETDQRPYGFGVRCWRVITSYTGTEDGLLRKSGPISLKSWQAKPTYRIWQASSILANTIAVSRTVHTYSDTVVAHVSRRRASTWHACLA